MDVRKKVLLDLFASPGSLLPMVGGASALILSWLMKGSAATVCLGLGLAGLLAGLGVFATRLVLGLEDITKDAYQYVLDQKERQREEALDQLDRQLSRDNDPRTQQALRGLRELYDGFSGDVRSGKISRADDEVVELIDRLFESSVGQLRRSFELWRSARRLRGPARQEMLDRREEAVREVLATIEHLRVRIEQFRALSAGGGQEDLGRLRGELDEALRVARRVDQRVAALENDQPIQNPSEQE